MDATSDPRKRDGLATSPRRSVVLVVDDVPNNRLAFEAMLRRDDLEIVTVGSGREALEVLLARDVAVAIIDVQMPEMDGFELASLIRGVAKTRLVPIIFVTAGSHDEARVFRGYEAGAVDYLFKPVDQYVLRGKVDVFVTLEKHRHDLEEADRMREMFIAVLGHDLRSPVGGVLMSTQLLLRRLDPGDPSVATIDRIRETAMRMQRMIEQLLDAARFRQDGTVELEPERVDLRKLAAQVLSELSGDEGRFLVEAAGDLSGHWDPDRVLQVLSNLIGNAAHHSPPESPVVLSFDGTDDEVRLRIHNGGPPIPPALRPLLFQPFRRAQTRRDGANGLGLGLYITQQLVRAHRGTVEVESSEEDGTTFTVTLPRSVDPSATVVLRAATPSEAMTTEPEIAAQQSPVGATILLVEDDASSRGALEETLTAEGYRVLGVETPSEALEAVAHHRSAIDLLVTDLRLPGMNGEALADRVRGSTPGIKVVFMSASVDPFEGATAFVQKPIELGEFLGLVERVLSSN